MISKRGGERKWRKEEEHLERGEGEDPIPHLSPVMKAVTEKEEDGEVLTDGVQSETETDRGGRGTEVERAGRAAAETEKAKETETKLENKGRRVKIGSEGGLREVGRGPIEIETDSAPVHPSHLIAQGLIRKAVH